MARVAELVARQADEITRTGLGSTIRVESHGPAQFKTRSQTAQVYSVSAGQRP